MTQPSSTSSTAGSKRQPAAAWYADPSGRYEHRYWDGHRWTEHVASNGKRERDPSGGGPAVTEPTDVAPRTHEQAPPQRPVAPTAATPNLIDDLDVPRFGARGKALELAEQVKALRAERDSLQAERARLADLGALGVAELENRSQALRTEIADQSSQLARARVAATEEIDQRKAAAEAELQKGLEDATTQLNQAWGHISELRATVVDTEELAILQEVGVYEYRHPLSDAVAYQAELKRLQDKIKAMARKDGGAVVAADRWTVNGSAAQGRTMIRDYSKLILRAYNAEADNLVRGLKPYKLDTSVDRLDKVVSTIERLGKTMDMHISSKYHRLRVTELELTADYLEKKAEEKEYEREQKARLREERQAQLEMERERARLDKEAQHHQNALDALIARGDEEGASRLREQLEEVQRRIEDVDYRAANIRAGYVYVISNLGSFGEDVVKVGMTRRLDPQDRVRELGDASVPFKFDVHAILFSQDAVGLESALHQRLADRRMNLVNKRREFFRSTPQEVKGLLTELSAEVLEYDELAAAVEYRQSLSEQASSDPERPDA